MLPLYFKRQLVPSTSLLESFVPNGMEKDLSREFIEKFLVWLRGSNVLESQNCMVLNFGFDGEIPYPQLRLTSNSDIGNKLFWRTTTFRSPNTCSIVIIGSKNLDKVSDIMKVVDGITENLQMMPFVTFLEVDKDDLDKTVDRNGRHNISPAMVISIVFLTNKNQTI